MGRAIRFISCFVETSQEDDAAIPHAVLIMINQCSMIFHSFIEKKTASME